MECVFCIIWDCIWCEQCAYHKNIFDFQMAPGLTEPNNSIKYKHFKFTRYLMRIKWNAVHIQSCPYETRNVEQFKVSAFFFKRFFAGTKNEIFSRCHFVLFAFGKSQSPKSKNINRLKLSEGDKHAFDCQKNSKKE